MPPLDVRTLFFAHVLTSALGVAVMALLWVQNRRRLSASGFWFASYAMQFIALLLIGLRGIVPDLVSILIANVLIVAAYIVLLDGLVRFIEQPYPTVYNYFLLTVFGLVHAHYTFTQPNLAARSINFALTTGCIVAQGSWLTLYRVAPRLRDAARPTGFVLLLACLIAIVQIVNNLARRQGNDLLHPDGWLAFFLLSGQILSLGLIFTLLLQVSRRLRYDLERELIERHTAELQLRESEERFSKAFQTSHYAVTISKMIDGKFIDVNDAFAAMTGYTRSELLGRTSFELNMWVHAEQRDDVISALSRGESVVEREYLLRTRNGSILTARFSAQAIQLSQAGLCMISSIADVTARKQAEQELRDNRRFLAELIEHSGALICTKDWEGRYELVNHRWEQATGIARDKALGSTDLQLFPSESAEQFRHNDLDVLRTGAMVEREEHLQTAERDHWFLAIKFPLRNDEGNIVSTCGILTDITERKEADEKIRHLANHDHLTNLPSLRLARDRLGMAIRLARREQRSGCVMFIDLDGFKAVNDTRGHNVGDLLLKELSRRLVSRVRQTDTVARIGGDEFLIIAGGLHSADDAVLIARKVLEELKRPVLVEGFEDTVSASIGIALFPKHGDDIDQLIVQADQAMYRVKKARKNGICVVGEAPVSASDDAQPTSN